MFYDDASRKPPPYATYPEYDKTPTRAALASQLNAFFKEHGLNRNAEGKDALDIDKLINDLVEQLREMEHTYDATRSPRSEVAEAEKQIRTVSSSFFNGF